MPGGNLCAAPRPETPVLDMHLIGLAFEFQAVVLGLRDKGPQLLHQHRPLPNVVKFPCLLAESLRRDPARRKQHVAVKIPLVALPAGLVDGEIDKDQVIVGQPAGNFHGAVVPAFRAHGEGIGKHHVAGGPGVGLFLRLRPLVLVGFPRLGPVPRLRPVPQPTRGRHGTGQDDAAHLKPALPGVVMDAALPVAFNRRSKPGRRLWRSRFHRRPGSPLSCGSRVQKPPPSCMPAARFFKLHVAAPWPLHSAPKAAPPSFERGDGAALGLAERTRTGRDPKNAPLRCVDGLQDGCKMRGLLGPL